MKKENIKFILIGVIVFAVVAAYICLRVFSLQGNRIAAIKIKNNLIYAEIVSSEEKMETGLGGRSNLCSSCGMLFEFPKAGKYSFWMKNMKFPLDILWISDHKIVHIEKNVQPMFDGTLNPNQDADMVLEINAGKTDEFGIEIGDTVSF